VDADLFALLDKVIANEQIQLKIIITTHAIIICKQHMNSRLDAIRIFFLFREFCTGVFQVQSQ
jgi:hypothetical protein